MQFFENLSNMQKVLVVVAAFIVGVMVYNMFNGAQGETFGDNVLKCTMYYVDWCPHCTAAKPHWEKLEKDMNGKTVNGKKILVTKVDCQADPETAKKQKIMSYPTFKFDLNDRHFTYNDEAVFDKLKAYISSVAYSNNF